MNDCDLLTGSLVLIWSISLVIMFLNRYAYWLSDKILNLVVHFLECVNESDFKICAGELRNLDAVPASCHCLVFSFQVISRLICFD